MGVEGRTALVVGGTSGIGGAIVDRLRGDGVAVVVASRDPSTLVGQEGVRTIAWDAEASELDTSSLPRALDALVYTPGTINLRPFQRLTDDDFRRDFELNVVGAVRAVRAALPALRRAESPASIVLFSTVAVGIGLPFHASVSAAKGAIEGLTRALAAELAPTIRVNAIAPSLTDTPLAAKLLGSEARRQASVDRHPMHRIAEAEEVARLACSLLGPELPSLTGQVVAYDGGLGSVRPG